MMATISLDDEKALAERVKLYPVLYNKLVEGYNVKDVSSGAWEQVAQELDFAESGTKAQSLYLTLKKKYQRKKRDLADATNSGVTESVTRAQRALRPYQFMSWLDEYFVPRQKKRSDYRGHHGEDDELYDDEYSMVAPKDEYIPSERVNLPHNISSFDHHQGGASNYGQHESSSHDADSTQGRSEHSSSVKDMIQNVPSRKRKSNEEDKEDLFCRSLAADLRDMPPYERCMARNEISNIIYKYQMKILTMRRDPGNR